AGAAALPEPLVLSAESGEVPERGVTQHGDDQEAAAVLSPRVDRETEVDPGPDPERPALGVAGEVDQHLGHAPRRPCDRVGDEVGEGDLDPGPVAAEGHVEQAAPVVEETARDGPDRGGGGDLAAPGHGLAVSRSGGGCCDGWRAGGGRGWCG